MTIFGNLDIFLAANLCHVSIQLQPGQPHSSVQLSIECTFPAILSISDGFWHFSDNFDHFAIDGKPKKVAENAKK